MSRIFSNEDSIREHLRPEQWDAALKQVREGAIAASEALRNMAPHFHKLAEAMKLSKIHLEQLPFEKRAERLMRRMFRAQEKALSPKLRISRGIFEMWRCITRPENVLFREATPANTLFRILDRTINADAEDYQSSMASVIAAAIRRGGRSQAVDLSVSFSIPTDRIERTADDLAGVLITGVNDTTRQAVRDLISAGIRDRQTYTQVARSLRERFEEFSVSRARMIAVTEIGNAYVRGQQETDRGLIAAGIEMEKASILSDGACPICIENGEAGWIPYESEFPSGDEAPLFHPTCRCALMSQRKEA